MDWRKECLNFLKNNLIGAFFLGLFVLTILSIFLFNAKKGELFADVDSVNLAKIDVHNFMMHQMKSDMIDTLIIGKKATQFKDYETFRDISISRSLDHGLFETILGKIVHRKNNIYSFYSGVEYQRSDALGFYSQSGVLNVPKELFSGKGDFKLESKEGEIVGKNIVYDRKNAMIYAKKIQSKIFLEDK